MENVLTQHIVCIPGVVGGKPHVAGHRVRVMDIVAWHEKRSLSPDQIVDLFPDLTLADIYAALAYYFDHEEEIEADFQQEANTIQESRSSYPSKVTKKPHG